MSRIRFPRVATRTRPPAPKPKKLPPLRTEILQDGKVVRIEEQPDPRILFCEVFNRDYARFGMSARPVMEGGAE